ncbi:MAG: hypothetical protein IPH88_14145 [Bacteroidales bacterium]|nr:hypothetical protein [Bacteroidales bacterium]
MQALRNLRSPSLIAAFILSFAIFFFRFVYPPVNILSWDVFGYYLYLPAQFIYHDLSLNNLDWVKLLVDKYQTTGTLYQLYPIEGHWVIKESIGLAVLNFPAFLLAHFYAGISGFATDGFSIPYQYAFAISGLIYAAIGIFVLRKILLEYFSETTSLILMLLIVGGTNHFQLTAFDGMLSHNYIFTIYTGIVWFTIQYHKKPTAYKASMLGLMMGLAVLCRPSEMVCILIPLFWGVYNLESLKNKWFLIRDHWFHIILLALFMFVGGFPQMLYWKEVTGNWIYYTYQNPGEGLDLWSPHTMDFLFSYRKGWFLYTPLMVLAFVGFIQLFRKHRAAFWPILIYSILNLWIISSWTAWWYGGGSYSQRAMLPSYVLMALPLGYLIESLRNKGNWVKGITISIFSLILLLNIFQTWQWAHGIIDRTRMTREYYWAIFGQTKADPKLQELLLVDQLGEAKVPENSTKYKHRELVLLDYENAGDYKPSQLSDTAFSGHHAFRLDPATAFAGAFEKPFRELTGKDHAWFRISVRVFPVSPLSEAPASLVASFEHERQPYKYKADPIEKLNAEIKTGEWNLVSFDFLTPDVRSVEDTIKIYFWFKGSSYILIDDFRVEMWEPN